MHITSWAKRENSGLFRTTLELIKYTERLGHHVCLRQPHDSMPMYGTGDVEKTDLHTVHSQINPSVYHDSKPRILYCHGEPLSSVGNGVSMRAIVDLAPLCDAFIAFRKDEWIIWNSIKRTYVVPKGIDLDVYKPLDTLPAKLSGEPSVLYYENWRGSRNPLYPILAMQEVHKKYPNARLHLYNVQDKKMHETFKALIDHCHFSTFVRSLQGPVDDTNALLNTCDIVISGLYPLYARSIECFGAGKPLICPGYRENNYPFQCELQPESMADAVIRCWEKYDVHNWRSYAEQYHNAEESTRQCLAIYERYL